MGKQQVLQKLDTAWAAFRESYAGLSERQMTQPGVTGAWSVKDIVAHVTTWEEEALTWLPVVLQGRKPPRYSVAHGGIHAFNARMVAQQKGLALSEVLGLQAEIHHRLVEFIDRVPAEELRSDTRFRRRLRLDTYGHYPKHAQAIRAWRERLGARP